MSLKKIALVTGASRGIGAAAAKQLAQQGYLVAVNYRENQQQAENVVNEIKQNGGQAFAIQADVGNEKDVIKLFQTLDQHGSLVALVNNAGITHNGEVAKLTGEELERVFAINVYSHFWCCREAIQRMQKNGQGAIVNVTSEAAKFGGNRITAYAASKAAISTFTVGLAREVAKDNIRVNAVSPGIIATDMHKDATPEKLSAIQQSLPMGRMGTAHEVAATIAWLVSEEASYLSGAIIPVTGAR